MPDFLQYDFKEEDSSHIAYQESWFLMLMFKNYEPIIMAMNLPLKRKSILKFSIHFISSISIYFSPD